LKKGPASNRPATGWIPRSTKQATALQLQQAKKAINGRLVAPLLVILTLLIIVLLAFLVPSADVTLTLPSHDYPLPMTLTATATSRQDVVHQTLPAHTLVFDTTVTGLGHATGSTTGGTKATGNVVFTNTGASPIIIPTGTIVSTKNGVPFVTQAEPEVLPGNPIVTPIQAQNPGANGNVPANSITTIPSDSQTRILQANPGLTRLTLSVTNTDPTTGGGAANATSVSSNDVNAEKTTLDSQVQAQVKDFLKKNVHPGDPGDQQGTPIQLETPIATPAVGQVATDGTFRETLKLHMTVHVVRAADLHEAMRRLRAVASSVGLPEVRPDFPSPLPSFDVPHVRWEGVRGLSGSALAIARMQDPVILHLDLLPHHHQRGLLGARAQLELHLQPRAEKDLRRMSPGPERARILAGLRWLGEDPSNLDIKSHRRVPGLSSATHR